MNTNLMCRQLGSETEISIVVPVKAICRRESDALVLIASGSPALELVAVGRLEVQINHAPANLRIVNEDLALYSAMNLGLRIATGRYVLFMGIDDELLHENVLFVADKLRALDGAAIVALPVMIGHRLVANRPSARGPVPLHHQGVLFSREHAVALGGYSNEWDIHSDLDLMLRIQRSVRAQWIATPLIRFAKGGMSTSGLNAWQSMWEINDIFSRHRLKRGNFEFLSMMLRLLLYRLRYILGRLRHR